MKVTITPGTLATYAGPETELYLRVVARETFMPSTGETVVGRSVGDVDFYSQELCPVSGGLVTYPAFIIDSTADAISDPENTSYSFALFSTTGRYIKTIYRGLRIPAVSPTTFAADRPERWLSLGISRMVRIHRSF